MPKIDKNTATERLKRYIEKAQKKQDSAMNNNRGVLTLIFGVAAYGLASLKDDYGVNVADPIIMLGIGAAIVTTAVIAIVGDKLNGIFYEHVENEADASIEQLQVSADTTEVDDFNFQDLVDHTKNKLNKKYGNYSAGLLYEFAKTKDFFVITGAVGAFIMSASMTFNANVDKIVDVNREEYTCEKATYKCEEQASSPPKPLLEFHR